MLVIEIWVMQIGSGEVSVRSFAQVVMDIVTDLNSSSEFAFWLRLSKFFLQAVAVNLCSSC